MIFPFSSRHHGRYSTERCTRVGGRYHAVLLQFHWSTSCATREDHLAERYRSLLERGDDAERLMSRFLDGKPLVSDGTRTTTSTELPNATLTVLHIVASRPSDSGSYRCSDGHSAQSKEAKLYLRDSNLHHFLRSLSSSSSSSSTSTLHSSFYRTVLFFLLMFPMFFSCEEQP